jgi:hypothetical protein
LSQLRKQKLEAAGSSGAVQALRIENDALVVGPDALTVKFTTSKGDYRIRAGTMLYPIQE